MESESLLQVGYMSSPPTFRDKIRAHISGKIAKEQFDDLCHWEDQFLAFANSAAEAAERAEDALRQLASLMDYTPTMKWQCENECEGCRAEMVEASRIVREAMAE